MRKQNAVCLAVMAAGLLVAGRALAGSLDPTAAPGPTMHTLEEIYQKVSGNTYSATVPKTGQITPYQTGDDGTYQKGVAWPNPRFTVQADTNCVLDNLTGLIWARNAFLLGDDINWSNAVVYCEELNYGGQTDWRLPNVGELHSLIVWRYYNPALCNTVGTGKLTENVPFAGVQNDYYWSSTSYASNTDSAWGVDMYDGYVDYYHKTFPSHLGFVWPVRGGQ